MSRAVARKVLEHEAASIRRMERRLDGSFEKAVRIISKTRGRVVLVGMGKPGFIAQKISASLASTGTPSMYLHPADAVHGDIGRVIKEDVVIALSKSGETEEILRLVPMIRKIGCSLISLAGSMTSRLALESDVTLDVSVEREAEPLNVAPTASSVCMLAMGDCIVMALVGRKKFKKKDFARLHPGGSIGKHFYLSVRDVMRKGAQNPCVGPNEPMREALFRITAARAGSVTVVDARGRCLGIFTDGDLRRRFGEINTHMSSPISRYMTRNPLVVREDELASEALDTLRRKQVDELPVVNAGGKVTGLLDVQDLLKQGFVL